MGKRYREKVLEIVDSKKRRIEKKKIQ